MKQSETTVIKRSEINLNPYNPKHHTEEAVNYQKKNIRKVGFLGGIVYNKTTSNLVDGHRRVQALDSINNYDGTPETDYDVKVELVEMDEKSEKEQMTYMATGNSKADYNLIAEYIDDIDFKNAGLTEDEYKAILELKTDEIGIEDMPDLSDMFTPTTELKKAELTNDEILKAHDEKPKMTKEEVKAEKQHCDNVANKNNNEDDLYIVMSFDSMEEKQAFCDAAGLQCNFNMVVKGDTIMRALGL